MSPLLGPPHMGPQHMLPQSQEDLLFSRYSEVTLVAGWAVVVTYMQWWRILRVRSAELQVLSISPGLHRYAAAEVVIGRQDELTCVPDEYVVAIGPAFPHRLCSTAVPRARKPCSTAVEF